jgi:prevent-host-death family protein
MPADAEPAGDVDPGPSLPKELTRKTIGVRELKNNLSRVLRRIQAGAQLTVTDRGVPIAILGPLKPVNLEGIYRMIAKGKAHWNGEKPKFPRRGVKPRKGGKTASEIVLEDRGPR